MSCRTIWAAVLTCWLLIATAGHYLAERPFLIALGGLMVGTIHATLRGRAWLEALRLGRQLERARRPAIDADTVDLTLYRQGRQDRAS